MKKLTALFLAIALCLGLCSFTVIATVVSVSPTVKGFYSGDCGENLTWSLITEIGTLEISGTGEMSEGTQGWDNYSNNIKKINIAEGVTSIASGAFFNCTNLYEVSLPESLTHIGDSAFKLCSNLRSVDVPDGVTHIGDYAFSNCRGLSSITLPKSVSVIGECAFTFNTSLSTIVLPDNLAEINPGIFSYCGVLRSIVIPKRVTFISRDAFYECDSLGTVYYTGGADEWADVTISPTGNAPLENANIIFNYGVEDESSEEGVADVSSEDESFEDLSYEVWESSGEPVEEPSEEQRKDDSFVETVDVLYGDVNGDGDINSLDAAQVLKYDAQLIVFEGDGLAAADVNADGKVDSLDAAQILKYDAQLIDSFPAGDRFAGSDETSQPSNNSENENVEVLPSIEAEIGEYVTFGSYEQDNNTANGKEDIEWLVLDKKDGRMLVISKYGLDARSFHSSLEGTYWCYSGIEYWLNDGFIETAFSEIEQHRLITVTTNPDSNPEYNSNQGHSSEDKVFLLSSAEANKYFNSDAARACLPTAYAIYKGAYVNSNGDYQGYCYWWLRTVGGYGAKAACVDADGDVDNYGGSQSSSRYAIRPAMWISTGEIEIEIVPEDSSGDEGYSGGAEIGEYITFGSYEQDNNTANGKEAIEWLVLDKKDGRMLVTSKYLLDVQPFHSSYSETTWEHSALRQWMNNDFYNIAFNSAEKAKIPTVTAIADVNEFVFTVTSGNDTQDKLFCLNKTELLQYFPDRNSRACSPTPYAEALGTRSFWWLRTSGGTRRMAVYVETDGDINPGGTIVSNACYIRPAMWIEID